MQTAKRKSERGEQRMRAMQRGVERAQSIKRYMPLLRYLLFIHHFSDDDIYLSRHARACAADRRLLLHHAAAGVRGAQKAH